MTNIYKSIQEAKGKQYAVLIDPDKYNPASLEQAIKLAEAAAVDFFFVGGSLLTSDVFNQTVSFIKAHSHIPSIIFPGSIVQIHKDADAILLLSLISGRNPELLIGKHVLAAPYLKASKLEIMPTGYMLVESGTKTTAEYISETTPLPREKEDIAVCTALAGEMLGMKLIYLDAGSGATLAVPEPMIKSVKAAVSLPVIVGGGIRSPLQAAVSCRAGADLVVTGNVIEEDPGLIKEISDAIHACS